MDYDDNQREKKKKKAMLSKASLSAVSFLALSSEPVQVRGTGRTLLLGCCLRRAIEGTTGYWTNVHPSKTEQGSMCEGLAYNGSVERRIV